MSRFPIYSFALVLLHPAGIDTYLVGLPRITADPNASEVQLYIAFSVYLAGMIAAMLFAGRVADRPGRKLVAIPGAALFITAPVFCLLAETGTLFPTGRSLQGLGAGCCYVVAFATLRDMLGDRRRAKVLSSLNGVTCIIPVLAPVPGHLIMLKFPWQSLSWAMVMMGIAILMLSLFILKETRPAAPIVSDKPRENSESLPNRFSLSRVVVTTLSVSMILTFVDTSPVLLMEIMGFERGECATIMVLTVGVSTIVSFSTSFALGILKPRALTITSQVLLLAAGITLAVSPSHAVSSSDIALICVGLSVGLGVAISQALGSFSLRAGIASSTLGIAQACGSLLWIWLAAVVGIGTRDMLTEILIACNIMNLSLIMLVAPGRPVAAHEEIHYHTRSQSAVLSVTIDVGAQRNQSGEADKRDTFGDEQVAGKVKSMV